MVSVAASNERWPGFDSRRRHGRQSRSPGDHKLVAISTQWVIAVEDCGCKFVWSCEGLHAAYAAEGANYHLLVTGGCTSSSEGGGWLGVAPVNLDVKPDHLHLHKYRKS